MLFPKKYKYILSCDIESTGFDVHRCDWITASFGLLDFETRETVKELELESRPKVWHEEAYEIHLIMEETAMKFQPRDHALNELVNWLPPKDEFIFLCHANTNNYGTYSHFDYSMLKMDFMREIDPYAWYNYFLDENVYSTHTIARNLQKRGLLDRSIKKGLKPLCDHFGIEFEHHNCHSDRKAMESLLGAFYELEAPQLSFV